MSARFIGSAAAGLVVALVSSSDAADRVQDRILAAMLERASAAKTVEARIEERSLLAMPAGVGRTPAQEGEAGMRPGKQMIIVKDAKLFRRLNRIVWSGEAEVPEEMTSVFDGVTAGSLHVTAKSSVGYIHSKRQHADRHNLHVLPIVGHFRALTDDMTILSPDKWHVVSTDFKLDDSTCVLVREGSEEDVQYRELWFDAEKNFSLVRRRDVFDGKTANLLNVQYTEDEAVAWVPKSWQVDRYIKGRLIDHSEAKVVSLKINGPVDDAVFQFNFPPGTEISDQRQRKPRGKKS